MGIFDRLHRKGNGPSHTTITSVNVMWGGGFHTLDGMKPEQRTFEFSLPFDNTSVVENLPADTFQFADTTVQIKSIAVDRPFELVGVTPSAPLTIKTNEKVSFRFTIKAPEANYSGPMTIRFAQDESDVVKIEINKVSMIWKGRKTDIENSAIIMHVKKNHIFKNSVQLYKALSFNDRISGVSVNRPFALVSTQPTLPFTISNMNSFIADFYIQAPEMSYSGPLEITFS